MGTVVGGLVEEFVNMFTPSEDRCGNIGVATPYQVKL